MTYSPIIAPVTAVVVWSLLASQINVLLTYSKNMFGENFDPSLTGEELITKWRERGGPLPEHPVFFYIVCLALAYIGAGDGLDGWLAWAFAACWAIYKLPKSLSDKYLCFGAGCVANMITCALAIYAGFRVTRDMLTAYI